MLIIHAVCMLCACEPAGIPAINIMQTGFFKLDSHLKTLVMSCVQLWTNPAAAVLIYVWALSEVHHNLSGLLMSACLNVKPPVHMAPKNHGIASLRLQNMPWHTMCDRLFYDARSRRLTHRVVVTALFHDLQTPYATVNSGECLQVVRYPWYATSLLNCCPSWLTWLRSALQFSLHRHRHTHTQQA